MIKTRLGMLLLRSKPSLMLDPIYVYHGINRLQRESLSEFYDFHNGANGAYSLHPLSFAGAFEFA